MAKKTINKELTGAQDLYNFLFEACNIIRGPVSQDNFKDYITPLLYYKRISDVYDEETEEALISSGGDKEYASLPEQHRFVIPDGCHWQEVRERTENLGAAIVGAMRQIEIANPDTLYGVLSMFSSQKWTNKAILNDSKIRDLIEHLSKRKLGNKDYPADLMGDAYEILLKKFADDSKAQAGEFYTPRSVVRLLVHILDPQPGETVYDPACGSGGMLIEAIRYMHDDSLCCGSIFGQEKNVVNAAIAKMNLFLHGASDFNVMQGDTLRDPKILQGGNIAKFDCVIANPPFSLENWGATEWSSDKYKRNIYGTPSDSCGDYAWIQHMICSMSSGKGRMAVVMPQGILFRGNQEAEIRKQLVESDLIEAVVTLGDKLFYGTGLSPCFLIIRRMKPAHHSGRILMIDGSKILTQKRAQNILEENDLIEAVVTLGDKLFYGTGLSPCFLIIRRMKPAHHSGRILMIDGSKILTQKRAQNILEENDIDRLYSLYQNYSDEEDYSRIVTLQEIRDKEYNLSPNRYVVYHKEEIRPYAEVLAEFKQAYADVKRLENEFSLLINA